MKKITQKAVDMATVGMMKPCPFCGNRPTARLWHGGSCTKILIGCESDVCNVAPSCTGETPEEGLAAWNRRFV